MRELKCNKHTALGLAVEWFCWIDEQTEDGATGLTPDELADELGFRGSAKALCSIGWAALGDDGTVNALEFGKHCGDSAKKRAEDALRQSSSRSRRAAKAKEEAENVTEKCDECHGETVTNVTKICDKCHTESVTRKEKNRIEENNNIAHTLRARALDAMPRSVDEVKDYLRKLPLLALTPEERDACAENFFDTCNERGWVTKDGTPVPIQNWQSSVKKQAEAWARHAATQHCAKKQSEKKGIVRPGNAVTTEDDRYKNL